MPSKIDIVKLVECRIEHRPEAVVRPLLQEVRQYADMADAPVGRDCGVLEEMIGIVE